MMLAAWAWLGLLLAQGGTPAGQPLTLGTAYAGAVDPDGPAADTSGLPPETARRVGSARRFVLRTADAGPHAFDLRSHHFDAYLVVRDADGALVAATDDGGFGTHAALDALELDGETTYLVDACAPPGAGGELTLVVSAGAAPALTRAEERAARLEDARQRIFAVERRDGYLADSLADACRLHGDLLLQYDRPVEARASYERALGILQELHGAEAGETLEVALLLADTYVRTGDHEGARSRFEQVAAALAEVHGAEDPRTVRARLGAAVAAAALGDPTALPALRDAARATAALGPDGAVLAEEARHALAAELARHGRLDEAAELLEQVLVAAPPTRAAASAALLSELLACRGLDDEAARSLEVRLARLEETAGRDHPAAPDLLEPLGARHVEAGRFDEAFAAFERAWLLRASRTDPDDPVLARAALGSAAALAGSGELEGAIAQLEILLGGRTAPTPEEHPAILGVFANVARLEAALGETRDAAERLEALRSLWAARAGDPALGAQDLAVDAALVALLAGDAESAWWGARGALDTIGATLGDDLWALAPEARLLTGEVVRRALDVLDTALPLVPRPERELFAYRAHLGWRALFGPELLSAERALARGRTSQQWIHVLRHRGLAAQMRALLDVRGVEDLALNVEQVADLRRRTGYLKWEVDVVDGPSRARVLPDLLRLVDALPAGTVVLDLATYRPWVAPRAVDGAVEQPAHRGPTRARAWLLRSGVVEVERFELGAVDDGLAPPPALAATLADAARVLVCPAEGLDAPLPDAVRATLPAAAEVRLLPDATYAAPGLSPAAAARESAPGNARPEPDAPPGASTAPSAGDAAQESTSRDARGEDGVSPDSPSTAAGREAGSAAGSSGEPGEAGAVSSAGPERPGAGSAGDGVATRAPRGLVVVGRLEGEAELREALAGADLDVLVLAEPLAGEAPPRLDRWKAVLRACDSLVRAAPRDRLRAGRPRGVFPRVAAGLPQLDAGAPLDELDLSGAAAVLTRGATPELLRVLLDAGAATVLVAPADAADADLVAVLRALVDGEPPAAAATAAGWLVGGR